MAAPGEEALEVGQGKDNGRRVDVGMERHVGAVPEIGVHDHMHSLREVVDEAEGRDRAGREPEVPHQPLRRPEAQPVVAYEVGQPLQVDGLAVLDPATCIGCLTCVAVCPQECIDVLAAKEIGGVAADGRAANVAGFAVDDAGVAAARTAGAGVGAERAES